MTEIDSLKKQIADLTAQCGGAITEAAVAKRERDAARMELAKPEATLLTQLVRLSVLNPALHPGLPFQIEQIHAALAAIRARGGP